MKRLSARLLTTAVALLIVTASHARADLLDWGYHWSISPNNGIIQGTNPSTLNGASTGSVAIAVAQNGTDPLTLQTSSTIPAATVTTTSSTTSASPDSYKSSYNLTLTLTDPSQASGTVTFAGLISGSLTATSSSLTNTFQNTATNPLTQSITLGGHVYQVTIDPTVANLPIPGSSTPTLLDAIVKVSNSPPGGGGGQTPEPASLVLGGLGFSLLGVGSCWKRNRQPARSAR
jgi:PEP-CTERM motif